MCRLSLYLWRQPLRVLTWNLNARIKAVPQQTAAIADLNPDVVSLQEVTARSWRLLSELLAARGYSYHLPGHEYGCPGSSRLPRFSAVVSRVPFEPLPAPPIPAPEVAPAVLLKTPAGPVTFVAVHIPTRASPFGGVDLKLATQEGLLAWLTSAPKPIILAGDLNAPKAEPGPGEVVTFMPKSNPRLHAAELGFHVHPQLIDAFRACNGYETSDISWSWKNRGRTGGYRLDHILATAPLTPSHCAYAHHHRLANLSDHSPLLAAFQPLSPGAVRTHSDL